MAGFMATTGPTGRSSSWFRWPTRILGPAPGLRELNLACWGLFLGFVILPIAVPICINARSGTAFSKLLPVDFTYFYGIGRIVNEYSFARLYDYGLQLKVFNQIYPLTEQTYGPSPYPPFVALFFSLFARIPFLSAYLIWVATSLALYMTGIYSVVRIIYPSEKLKASLVFCFALGFYPFFICTLKMGQLSALAVFAAGLAIMLEDKSQPVLSGLALSILAYKPTLLLLIFPMLLITRKFRTLCGFLAGSAILILVATAFAGLEIWPAYLHFLVYFRQASASNGQSVLQLWQYVDFSSLSYAIPGGRSVPGQTILAAVTFSVLIALTVLLWKSANGAKPAQFLAWAATLTWTLLLNVYVPVWDSILVTIALLLTLAAMRDLGWDKVSAWVLLLALLIFAATWNMAAIGNHIGGQRMTALLFLLGLTQLGLLHKVTGKITPRLDSAPDLTCDARR